MSRARHRRRPSPLRRPGRGLALAIALGVTGCFASAWTGETVWAPAPPAATPPEPSASGEPATRIRLDVDYVEAATPQLVDPQGAERIRGALERQLGAPYQFLRPESRLASRGRLEIRCAGPTEAVRIGSAFAALFTLAILPGVTDYTIECDAALRDRDGRLVWHRKLERSFVSVASSLPYPYLIPGSHTAGVAGYDWVRRASEETLVEFARVVASELTADRAAVDAKLPGRADLSPLPAPGAGAAPGSRVVLPAESPRAERRLAVVVGNAAYATGRLANPLNDATDLAGALQSLGFDVTLLRDASQPAMESAVSALGERLREGGVGLFYFAGHGVQIDGENYLVPVDAQLLRVTDARYRSVSASWVVETLEAAGNGINIVILDACRHNPFARSWRSASRGLAVIRARGGTLIAYSTAPGQTAADGNARNSPYTESLLEALETPGLPVEMVFKRVGAAVQLRTLGAQIPWVSSSLTRDFSFRPD